MKFQQQSRATPLLKINKKYCSIIQIYILSISMNIQNLIEIHKLIHKILSINKILMSIKDQNSVKNWRKIMCIRFNMDLVFINAYTKFYQNSSICIIDIEVKHIFTSIKGHKPVVYKCIFAYLQSQTTPSWYRCQCKVWRKSVKNYSSYESGNDILTSIKGHNCCLYTNLAHLQPQTTPHRYQCPFKVWRKLVKKLLKLESRNEALTNRHSKFSEGN